MDDSGIVDEVEMAYRHCVDAFNRHDAVAFAACFDRPHAGLNGDHGLVLVTSDADHDRWCKQVMAEAEGQDWARTDIDRFQVWPFSPSLAQLVADVIHYKTDGSVRRRVRVSYMLRRRDAGWKVMTVGVVEEPFSGPALPPPGDDR
jgi:hypothetical protein